MKIYNEIQISFPFLCPSLTGSFFGDTFFFLMWLSGHSMYKPAQDIYSFLLLLNVNDSKLCTLFYTWIFHYLVCILELPWWLSDEEFTCQYSRFGFYPSVRKIPWSREGQATLVFLPGEFHGWMSLAGYSLWGHKRVRHDLITRQQPSYISWGWFQDIEFQDLGAALFFNGSMAFILLYKCAVTCLTGFLLLAVLAELCSLKIHKLQSWPPDIWNLTACRERVFKEVCACSLASVVSDSLRPHGQRSLAA